MSYITSIRKNTFLFLLTIGIINTVLALIVFLYIQNKQNELLYYSKLDVAKTEFKETNRKINTEINHYKLVLNTIKENKDLIRFLNGEKNIIKYLNEDFADFVKANENIFQLRLINKEGNEIIRIDKEGGITKTIRTYKIKPKDTILKKLWIYQKANFISPILI